MNWDQVEGQWSQFKDRRKEQRKRLMDDELEIAEARRDRFARKVQKRAGPTNIPTVRRVKDWGWEV